MDVLWSNKIFNKCPTEIIEPLKKREYTNIWVGFNIDLPDKAKLNVFIFQR